jgi:hypothetical protein
LGLLVGCSLVMSVAVPPAPAMGQVAPSPWDLRTGFGIPLALPLRASGSTLVSFWRLVLVWWLWALAIIGIPVMVWLDRLLRVTGRSDLGFLTPDAAAYLVGMVSAATVGALLASRRPRHPVGWLLLALGLAVSAAGVATGYANYGLLARPRDAAGR